MNKKIVLITGLLMTLILITNALAITASIGNARMILRADTGDSLEKSVLVKNVNDVAVNIIITASGDLQDSIKIKDNNFTLQANEEKNAFFTIKVTKSGTTESKINVQFTPVGEKNGAGLSSTIVVIADGEDMAEDTYVEDNLDENTDENNSSSGKTLSEVFSNIKLTRNTAALLMTCITSILFIIVLFIYYTRFNKNQTVVLKGDSLDYAWKKSRDSLITQLEKCESQEDLSDFVNSAVSEMRYLKAKTGKTKLKKKVKTRV